MSLVSSTKNGGDIALILAMQMLSFLIEESDLYHKSPQPPFQFPSPHLALLSKRNAAFFLGYLLNFCTFHPQSDTIP